MGKMRHKEIQLWKSVWKVLKKLRLELPYNPTISLLGIYPKESKSACNRETCTPMFIVALLTIAKLWNQTRCPKEEWKKKMCST
jgi:hypothetical protein